MVAGTSVSGPEAEGADSYSHTWVRSLGESRPGSETLSRSPVVTSNLGSGVTE